MVRWFEMTAKIPAIAIDIYKKLNLNQDWKRFISEMDYGDSQKESPY